MRSLKKWAGRLALTAIAGLLLVSAMTRLVSANLAVDGSEVKATAQPEFEGIALLLEELDRRETDLIRREESLDLREQDLRVAAEEIAASLDDLKAADAALEARMASSAGASDEDVDRLTRIYEGMKPKDAAAVFETMEPDFAAGFLARMAPDAAATILSEMPATNVYAISATIAGRNANAATEDRR
ncbi:MotE family protein [Jannaschia aquimarina]|uniref:MgtE intracellular N domain protein n=1 Tax=Jannaschia aquimarina TaxID=935700 RepID=A0A0D1D2G1_9RHOB|nr:hypothetical protein [Jannaschia aquimarina]KIT14288.1 MgtE intracellular N domain protein [Jannaschia aquimarina]SNS50087.1 MgtE intracellular N domain-containing protein [Jannaschia aquimarina]